MHGWKKRLKKNRELSPTAAANTNKSNDVVNFQYTENGINLNFELKGMKEVKCAKCHREFTRILRLFQTSNWALNDFTEFNSKFQDFRNLNFPLERKIVQNRWKRKSSSLNIRWGKI